MPEHIVLRRLLSWRRNLPVLGVWALAIQLIAGIGPAVAQIAAPSLEFVIPKSVVANEAAETPFVIELKYGDKIPADSWLEIVTVPASLSLSAGTLDNGIWRVPLADVPGLRLKVPADVTGDGSVFVMLIDNGTLMTVATANLSILPRASSQPSAPQASVPQTTTRATDVARPPAAEPETKDAKVVVEPSPVPAKAADAVPAVASPSAPVAPSAQEAAPAAGPVVAAAAVPTTTPVQLPPAPAAPTAAFPTASVAPSTVTTPAPVHSEQSRHEMGAPTPQQQRLLTQGERNLADGNIAIARHYFEAAAELGSAIGAFKLAETNDPYVLESAKVVGPKADPAEAIRWYRIAAELGMTDAEARVQRLKAR